MSGLVSSPEQVADWILEWFDRRAPGARQRLGRDVDFFAEGVIDSLGLLELIAELEAEFHIRLAEEALQDPRFPTVAGLTELIIESPRAE